MQNIDTLGIWIMFNISFILHHCVKKFKLCLAFVFWCCWHFILIEFFRRTPQVIWLKSLSLKQWVPCIKQVWIDVLFLNIPLTFFFPDIIKSLVNYIFCSYVSFWITLFKSVSFLVYANAAVTLCLCQWMLEVTDKWPRLAP